MYLDKLVLYIFFIVLLWVIITSIMTFIQVPIVYYSIYLYYITILFIFDLLIVKEPDL